MGHFTLESNEHVNGLTELDSFNIKFGEELIDSMYVGDIFRENGIEIIPAIYASGTSGKVLSEEAYKYIHDKMIDAVRDNLADLDGIYLFLHGASKVEGLPGGSGERYLLKSIRNITGPYLPISIVMDPHGNLTDEYVSMMTLGRCYRHSPHTDIIETHQFIANKMVKLLKNKKSLIAQYRKLPFVLGGEKSVSTDEPMQSINKELDKVENDPRILSASFHVGFLRHDNYSVGSGLIVVPSDMKYKEYAQNVLTNLYSYCVNRYEDFKFHGNPMKADKAVTESIALNYEHVVVTDSGDNVTSGALGNNTYLLRKYLEQQNYNSKKILFAGIYDDKLFSYLNKYSANKATEIELGTGENYLSNKIKLEVQIKNKGTLQQIFGDTDSHGETITLSVKDKPIDIVLLNKAVGLAEFHQFKAANIELSEYDLVIVKQGYTYPDLKKYADYSIMALTDGVTNQQTEKIVFKQIMRPMMPFDKLD